MRDAHWRAHTRTHTAHAHHTYTTAHTHPADAQTRQAAFKGIVQNLSWPCTREKSFKNILSSTCSWL